MAKLTFDLLQQEIDYVISNNEFRDAFESYNLLKNWLDRSSLAKNSPEYAQYNNYLMKLKLLSFNYLNDIEERIDLLKNYFGLSLEMKQFDLWEKLETELISISDLDERDAFKARMREALEKCDNILISRQKYVSQEVPRKVSEWTRNFVSSLGLDKFDKVKKMEYLSNDRFIKILDVEDKERVKTLLDIYEKLKISSKSPEGYENSVVMNIDGKVVIFNHGDVEEASDVDKIRRINIGGIKQDVSDQRPNLTFSPPDLKTSLKNYSPDSLEYKVIKEEINRLEKEESKKASTRK